MENGGCYVLLVGVQIFAGTIEFNVGVPQEARKSTK